MLRKRLIVPLLCLALMLCVSSVFANAVTVKGYGGSKEEAVSDALRNAVEQAVGTLVDSQTLVQNATVVTDEIYTKSRGFVTNFDVVNESRSGGGVEVTVTANVDTNPNSELMSTLQKLKLVDILRDPRVGVIVYESYNATPQAESTSEKAVMRKLMEAGFSRVVDTKQLDANQANNVFKALLQGNQNEAIAFASTYGLDYLIIGQATSSYVGNIEGSGIQSCRAVVEAKIVKAGTGAVLAANTFQAGGADITEIAAAKKSLNKAGESLGSYMVDQLMSYASNPEKGLQLIVKGINRHNKVDMIISELQSIRGIKAVYERSYEGGIATIDVNYTGAPKTLAGELEKSGVITLRVTSTNDSVIQATAE